jgi:hypothetical protein
MKTQCETCKHYFGLGQCAAFDQIPEVIAIGEHDHKQPFDGDRGILWEPAATGEGTDSGGSIRRPG